MSMQVRGRRAPAQRRPAPILRLAPSESITALIKAYLLDCEARGLLPGTLVAYGYALRESFLPFCSAAGVEEFEELDQLALNRYIGELRQRSGRRKGAAISEATVAHYMGAVKGWMAWCVDEYGLSPAGSPHVPAIRKQPRRVLSREQVQAMEDWAHTERDKVLVRLLADAGPRVGEVVRLRPDDLFQKSGKWFLHVGGKGGNERDVPVPRLWPRLRRLARARPEDAQDRLFLGLRRASGGLYEGIGKHGIEVMVRNLARAAGISHPVHPHLLRHSCITWLGSRGLNPFQISMIVGNFDAIDLYMHLSEQDAHAAMLQALRAD